MEKMARVTFLNQAGHAVGGAERTLITFLKNLPPGIEARVILFEGGRFRELLQEHNISVHVIQAPSTFLATMRENISLRAIGGAFRLIIELTSFLRKTQTDILYTNSMKAHFVGAIAARLAGVQCVMHFHDLLTGSWLQLLRVFGRYGAAATIACSQSVASNVGLRTTCVIPAPIELESFVGLEQKDRARSSLGLEPGTRTVGLIGRINRWKGHDRFIRIAAAVNARRRTQFVIIGSPIFRDDDFESELRTMVRALDLEEVVRFVPWVDDIATAYAAIDINVNCSTREPLGRSPLEAAAAGVPSVVFDDSGVADFVGSQKAGRVVPAGDERAFADAIVEMLDCEKAISREHLYAAVRPFGAKPVARSMASVIRSALPSSR